MALICPECSTPLQWISGNQVRCPAHGINFDVLFCRQTVAEPAPTPTGDTAPAGVCSRHPDVAASLHCDRCRALICATCAFNMLDGTVLCPTCATTPVPAGAGGGLVSRTPAALSDGAHCAVHTSIAAIYRCDRCRAPMCATCEFSFPGDIHLCPTCATTPQTRMGKNRTTMAVWSLCLAIWATLGTIGTMVLFAVISPGSDQEAELAGGVAMLAVVVPNIVGLGLGIASFERRGRNPWWLWMATIWNGLLVGIWILLMVIGLMLS